MKTFIYFLWQHRVFGNHPLIWNLWCTIKNQGVFYIGLWNTSRIYKTSLIISIIIQQPKLTHWPRNVRNHKTDRDNTWYTASLKVLNSLLRNGFNKISRVHDSDLLCKVLHPHLYKTTKIKKIKVPFGYLFQLLLKALLNSMY